MRIQTFILDSFTSTPFKGNPTGVCYLDGDISDEKKLVIAKELNFPVTSFIKKESGNNNSYHIQYFTPLTQIPACGHATLGSAAVIFKVNSPDHVEFRTIEDILIRAVLKDGLITMTYPRYEMKEYKMPGDLLSSLQIAGYQSSGYCSELETVFIELEDPAVLRTISPDYKKLIAADDTIIEVVITSKSDVKEYDFLLRSFCPWIGINEDPVTGSVHSVLAGFWEKKLKKPVLKAFQASERGGQVTVTSHHDKVEIGGTCVILLKGELEL